MRHESHVTGSMATNMPKSIDAAIYSALANQTRRDILTWLKQPAEHFREQPIPFVLGVCANLIVERAGMAQSSISAHLSVLQKAGLLSSARMGQHVFFKRNEEGIRTFLKRLEHEL